MAFPVILVDSATGSDTQASGAGPAVAIFGTTDASTDGAGTTVTLTAGTDLSGVATDGSHAIFLNDATAGNRNWGKITGTAGSLGATPTVTVSNAFGLSLTTKSWAIGGKRASIGSTTSKKLFENNSAAGDALPGWIVEPDGATHSETISALYACRRAGDTTSGPITLRGKAGSAHPVITFSNDGAMFVPTASNIRFEHLELRNSNASKTASIGIRFDVDGVAEDIIISHASNKPRIGITVSDGVEGVIIESCTIMNVGNVGVSWGGVRSCELNNCLIKSNASHGFQLLAGSQTELANIVKGNVFAANGADGANSTETSTGTGRFATRFYDNTFDSNTGDGLEFAATLANNPHRMGVLESNIFSNNGGYGLNFSGASMSDIGLFAQGLKMRANTFYNNTSGKSNLTLTFCSKNESTVNPSYVNAAGNDYTPGAASAALGFPLAGTTKVGGGGGSAYSYVDPGAHQRADGGGGVIFVQSGGGMVGTLRP